VPKIIEIELDLTKLLEHNLVQFFLLHVVVPSVLCSVQTRSALVHLG